MDDYTFMVQQRTFDVHGYALNPSVEGAGPIIGSMNAAHQNGYAGIDGMKATRAEKREAKRKRNDRGDVGVVDGDGAYVGPWAEWEGDKAVDPVVEEEAEEWREEKRRREEASVAAKEKLKQAREEKSIFHGELLPSSSTNILRQGAHRLRWTHIYAHSHRHRCQAQPVRWVGSPKRLCSRAVHTYMGESSLVDLSIADPSRLATTKVSLPFASFPNPVTSSSVRVWTPRSSFGMFITRAIVCGHFWAILKPSKTSPSTTRAQSSSPLRTTDTSRYGIPRLESVFRHFPMARSRMLSNSTQIRTSKTSSWRVCRIKRSFK